MEPEIQNLLFCPVDSPHLSLSTLPMKSSPVISQRGNRLFALLVLSIFFLIWCSHQYVITTESLELIQGHSKEGGACSYMGCTSVMLRASRRHLHSVLSSWDSRDSCPPALSQLDTTEQSEAQDCGPKRLWLSARKCRQSQQMPGQIREGYPHGTNHTCTWSCTHSRRIDERSELSRRGNLPKLLSQFRQSATCPASTFMF